MNADTMGRGYDRAGTDGRQAWTVALAAAVAAAVGLGTAASHGVLVAALIPLTIGGVGAGAVLVATSTVLQFGLSPVVGGLTFRWGVARVVLVGAVCYGAGTGVAATSGAGTLGVLAYAVGTGVAGACTLAPLLATTAGWFVRWRAAAIGLVSAGNGLGALVLAPWLATSVSTRGLQATWGLLAVVGSGALLAAVLLLRTPPVVGQRPAPWRWREVLADRPLRALYVAAVVGATGMIASLTYLVVYARSVGFRPEHAAGLLGLVGAVGVASRLAVVAVPAQRAFAAYRASQAAMAGSAVGWLLAPARPPMLVAFAVVFGVASGLWAALAPLVVAAAHPEQLTSTLGVLYTAPAIGGALGPLVAAALVEVASLVSVGGVLAGCFLVALALLRPLVPSNASPPPIPAPALATEQEHA